MVPGSLRNKYFDPLVHKTTIDQIINRTRDTHDALQEQAVKRRYKEKAATKNAKISYDEVKDGMRALQIQQNRKIWEAHKRFQRTIKKQHDDFKHNAKCADISKRRQVNQLFAARCRLKQKDETMTMAEYVK